MKLDLNLLRVFDILMEVRSVSRAADRLGLTQSAISHALGRLRRQLDDPLFTRGPGGLQPTRRAIDIAPQIRDGIALLNETVAPSTFDVAETTRSFTFSAGSYFCVTLMPRVIQRARVEAPHAQVRIIAPTNEFVAGLDDGTIDIALGGFRQFPARYTRTRLFSETMVWVGRAGDPVDLAQRPRLAITRPPIRALGEDPLIEQSLVEQFSDPGAPTPVAIHDVLSAGALVANSDLVTLLPRHLTDLIRGRSKIAILGPSDVPEWEMSMLWPTRLATDPAHVWLRGLVMDAAAELDG